MDRIAKKRLRPEREILKSIKMNLKLFCPSVLWVDRLQAGQMVVEGHYLRLGCAGTPDLYAIIGEGGGHLVFIECKRFGGKLRPEQKAFASMLDGLTHIHYVVAYDLGDVLNYIKKILDKPSE
jgi:hypothetical protein